ncbi:MAG: MFS transporter [Bacillota bacterium]
MENKHWKRKFFAIYTGQFFSLLSSAAVQFSIIWWLTDTTGSPLVLTLAGLAGFLPQAFAGPFAGTLTDRYSRKMIMILADMTVALGSLILFTSYRAKYCFSRNRFSRSFTCSCLSYAGHASFNTTSCT